MERIAMSQVERDWLDRLKRARDGYVTQKSAAEKMGITDRWVRASAYSPQATERVERSLLTDQDRLTKKLRLANVKTMEAANAFLEKEFLPEWNTKFTRPARGEEDLHRPLADRNVLICSEPEVSTLP